MIDDVLTFLRRQTNNYLRSFRSPDQAVNDLVAFPDGKQSESVSFTNQAVNLLLINIEEEAVLRDADPYVRVKPDGVQQRISPDIRLNLYILFASRHDNYEEALKNLSRIIQFFQRHRAFAPNSAPDLPSNVEKLLIELITLPFNEQNEVWSSLRVAYLPSVLYRVKMIVFSDADTFDAAEVGEKVIRTSP